MLKFGGGVRWCSGEEQGKQWGVINYENEIVSYETNERKIGTSQTKTGIRVRRARSSSLDSRLGSRYRPTRYDGRRGEPDLATAEALAGSHPTRPRRRPRAGSARCRARVVSIAAEDFLYGLVGHFGAAVFIQSTFIIESPRT